MPDYEAVIGLEVHAQLKTRTKIFCSCSTEFGEEPNANVCPVCSGMPGVLPVLNEKAVEYAVKMGLAVDCEINRKSIFARKNYFYPDLPKGYQISQYEEPICGMGEVEIDAGQGPRRIGITRIHLEEDAGKSIHSPAENVSYVDLNRACTPLIEIVSEPDIRTPEEAAAYLRELRSILVYLGICDGNMEEGSFRCDANISIRPRGQEEFGIRTELKNMNSFKHVQKALEYEIERQADLLDDGEAVVQETRLYNASKGATHSMRGKEEAHDYRYYPDPDLVPVVLEESWIERWGEEMPELPQARRERFVSRYGLPEYDALVLTADREVADYFEAAVNTFDQPKKVSNFLMGEFLRELNQSGTTASACAFSPTCMGRLLEIVEEGVISGTKAKDIFPELFASGRDPDEYVKEKNLAQISDTSSLEATVDEVIEASPEEVAAFRGGKDKLMGWFVGQVMRKTKGQANPALVNQILREKLK